MSIVHDMLQHLGYKVLKATNGNDAIEITSAQEPPIQLLLTDVIMPDMNGRDLFTKLSHEHPDLKVIYMSGNTDDVIAHHGLLESGVHFIQKPFTTETVAGKIREVLH